MTEEPMSQLGELSTHLVNFGELLSVLPEAAVGYKATLEQQGWSPTIAEQLAAHALMTMQTTAMTGKSPS